MSNLFDFVKFSELKIAGLIFSASQVQITFYILIALIALLLCYLLAKALRKALRKVLRRKAGARKQQEPEPQYKEVFEVENELFEPNPYKSDPDTYFEESVLRSVTLTLIIGLREFLTKMAENPTDQHKAMSAVGESLEAKDVKPIAFTQWNQSAIQGIAARIILNGKSRTALLGPSVAMAKATAKFSSEISARVESAHAAGESVFVLAIDGLAYGVFSVSHRLVLIGSGDRI